MAAFLDGCRFNPAAGGTADWTFTSTVVGYQTPAAANVVNGRLYKYRAESIDLSQWEFGEGAYNTTTGVLTRTTVLYNSAGTTAKINFSTVPQIGIVALKEDILSIEEANGFSAAQQAQGRLNLGINQMVSTGSSADFNGITNPGSYYTPDTSAANAPVASVGEWYLTVETYGSSPTGYVKQLATRLDVAGAATYVRTLVGGTWGAWQQYVGNPMPTVQNFTSGSGTYNPTSTAVKWVEVFYCGGGGGGSGSSSTIGVGGSSGTASSFNSVTAAGGGSAASIGGNYAATPGVTGGTGTATRRMAGIPGGIGGVSPGGYVPFGGPGGGSIIFGGGGSNGGAGAANSGGGGCGAFASSTDYVGGNGGGGGESVYLILPAASYSYSIGAGGAGGVGALATGGAGAAGRIQVVEHYQ